jgi:hypothetical protein
MAYINPAPGTTNAVVLKIDVAADVDDLTLGATPLTVPALQDVTINAANDVFTWSQLDSTAKEGFSLKFQEGGATDKFIKGTGYITGLAPTVSADAPVWVTPITITVTGEYTASASE